MHDNLHDALVEAFLVADRAAPCIEFTKRDAAAVLADAALDVIDRWTAKEPDSE